MTRPIYQTPEQRARELWFGALTACKWGCEYKHMPDLHPYDFELYRQKKLMALLEIKGCEYKFGKWPTFVVSSSKWQKIKKAGVELGVPVFLVAVYHDVFRFIKVDFEPDTVMGGRYDRDDPADKELMVIMPVDKFKNIGTCNKAPSGKKIFN